MLSEVSKIDCLVCVFFYCDAFNDLIRQPGLIFTVAVTIGSDTFNVTPLKQALSFIIDILGKVTEFK